MDLAALRSALRTTVLDDTVVPYQWSDETLTRFFNNAVREACIRARLLKVDAVTDAKACRIAVAANQDVVKFDPSILAIRSGIVEGGCDPLYALPAESMDKVEPGWDNGVQVASRPCYMVMDLAQKSFRLFPAPSEAIVLRLRAWRVPKDEERMTAKSDEPVIALSDPEELKHWAAHEAYASSDGELQDLQKSAMHLDLFENRFGPRPTLHEMSRWADSPPRVRLVQTF